MQKIIPTLKPSYKQHLAYEKLWDDVTSFLLFGGGAEGGKSWFGAEWLLQNCYRYPGSKWFVGRHELKQLMKSTLPTFRKVCAFHNIPKEDWKFNGQYNYIEFRNPKTGKFDDDGSKIDFLDLKFQPSDPEFVRFGSTEYTGGWIEEAGQVHFLAFDVLKSRVGRWMNAEYGLNPAKILITCNPQQNWLYRVFYKPWKKGELPQGYAFIQALYKDNPFTRDEAEQRLNQISDPVMRMRLKNGFWEYTADENSLLDYDSIVDLFTNTIDPSDDKYITADVARYGSDKVVIGDWKGFDLYKIQWKVKRGIDQTTADLKQESIDEQVPYSHILADDDGVGGGVTDNMRGIKGFIGNSSALISKEDAKKPDAKKPNYANLRSQVGFMIAERIKNHQMRISATIDEATKEQIIEDLQQLKKVDTPHEAPLRLIPKDQIKDSLGRSPDFGDMIMMREYFELVQIQKPVIATQTSGIPGYFPGGGF